MVIHVDMTIGQNRFSHVQNSHETLSQSTYNSQGKQRFVAGVKTVYVTLYIVYVHVTVKCLYNELVGTSKIVHMEAFLLQRLNSTVLVVWYQ